MKKKRNQQLQLNPKWAQLQQKLKSHAPITTTILGKRKGRPDEELDDDSPSRINPITPVSDDSGLTVEVAMDCEMVGVGQGNKGALGRVTLVNRWGNVEDDEFVHPVEHVVDFRIEITGIRPRDLRKAKDFRIVQKKVAELIKGRILVGHALRNDLKSSQGGHQGYIRGEGSRRALRHLAAEFLDVKIQNGEHCPIEDDRAAMVLYQKNRKAWEKRVKDQIKLKKKQKKRKPKRKRAKGDELETDAAETES